MIKLKKGDKVVWWNREKQARHLLRVNQPALKNKHGVPLDFTVIGRIPAGIGKAKTIRKRFSQLDQEEVLLLAPEKEWKTFIPFKLPSHIVVARIPGCAQPTYGLFNTNVANVGWAPLHGVEQSVQEIPLRFWRHGPEPSDMDWCLTRGEPDVNRAWRWPINGELEVMLEGADVHD